MSYCTNVHPAEDLPGLVAQFDRYAVPVRERLGADRLKLGLWLAADSARALADDPAALRRFRRELDVRGLAVETLNAFPYRQFHAPVVKKRVYMPDWTDPLRLRYAVDCATVLAGLLDDDATYGSISTLPLAWRQPWTGRAESLAVAALREAGEALRELGERHGRPLVLAVEPEPGCVLDTVADAVAWLPGRIAPDVIGLCVDTCHLAVSFADPARAVASIAEAGLRVMKVQVSAALEVTDPNDPVARTVLTEFIEPRFLHQVRELRADGEVLAADDLPEAVTGLPGRGPWRVHYHVPLHQQPRAPLHATTETTRRLLSALRTSEGPLPHLEIETYTWDVLPTRHRTGLVEGIAAELAWANANLEVTV
jgi:sugar phosphate isomerase/epimerase